MSKSKPQIRKLPFSDANPWCVAVDHNVVFMAPTADACCEAVKWRAHGYRYEDMRPSANGRGVCIDSAGNPS